MRRGTTPVLNFNFKYNLEELNILAFFISFQQEGTVVLEKTLPDIQIIGLTAKVQLTQEDTLKFKENVPLQIQARIKTDTNAYASNIVKTTVSEILKDGVI